MSLPILWVEKIFDKLTMNYGVEFMARYKGLPLADVKTDWADELACFEKRPSAIAFFLEHLPDRAPTAQQAKGICLAAQVVEKPIALAYEPKADPERVAQEMAKLSTVTVTAVNPKAWAYRLKALDEDGQHVSLFQRQCYRAALGLDRMAA